MPFVLSRASDRSEADRGPLPIGRVDMVHERDGKPVLIDCKTDKDATPKTAEQHALDKHSAQTEIYAHALAAATGLAVRELVFVYCKAGVEVRLRESAVIG